MLRTRGFLSSLHFFATDRTFSSTLRRFFDTSDYDHVYSKNHVAAPSKNRSASRSTIWATSTSTLNADYEGRDKEKGSIAMRRLGYIFSFPSPPLPLLSLSSYIFSSTSSPFLFPLISARNRILLVSQY